jgi:hypothetical protein
MLSSIRGNNYCFAEQIIPNETATTVNKTKSKLLGVNESLHRDMQCIKRPENFHVSKYGYSMV